MLFRKKITRSCQYCMHSTQFNANTVLCSKRGVFPAEKACRKFLYDPFRRIPGKAKATDFEQYNSEDYSL